MICYIVPWWPSWLSDLIAFSNSESVFEDFQNCHRGRHLGYWNGMILAILNLYVAPIPTIKFWLKQTYGLGKECRLKNFKISNSESLCHCDASYQVLAQSDLWFGRRCRLKNFKIYRNRMILAILNLCVIVTPPIKFQLNRTYSLEGDVVWRISRWLPWQPSWISESNDFSNSESLCCSNASHQVFAQSDLWFRRRCHLINFKMAAMAAILDIRMERF